MYSKTNISSTFIVLCAFYNLYVQLCTAEEGNICDRKPYLPMCRHKDKDLLQRDLSSENGDKGPLTSISSVVDDRNIDGAHNDSHNVGSTDTNDIITDISNGTFAQNVSKDTKDFIYDSSDPTFFEYNVRKEQLLNRLQTLDEEANKLTRGRNEYKTVYSKEYHYYPSSYTGGGYYPGGYTYPSSASSSYFGYPYAGSGGYYYPTYSNTYGSYGYPYGGGYGGDPGNVFNLGLGSGLSLGLPCGLGFGIGSGLGISVG